MELTLKLAEKGKGLTSPNPMVGCLIVKRGRIVGKGFHKKAGTEHAEVLAINDAGKKAMNSTMYVNLEPCSHWGRTPPCTEKIVEAGVREVIIGIKDKNRNSGEGIKSPERSLHKIYARKKAFCNCEGCNEHGRKDCNGKRRFKIHNKQGSKNLCPSAKDRRRGCHGGA